MALTLPEIFAGINNPNLLYNVRATLVVTQEDGRTSFLQSRMGASINPNQIANGQISVFFSDRDQFAGAADSVALIVRPVDAVTCELDVTLQTWNSQYNLNLTLPVNFAAVGKVYQGYGATIGNGTGRGLHCLSFEDFVGQPPPIN